MNEEIFDLLEECQMVLSAVVVEGTSEHTGNAGLMLAQIIQEIGRQEDMAMHEFDPDDPAGNIVSAVIPERPPLQFADVHPEVLDAVVSACNSAEDGTLCEWEIDVIESRIVNRHSKARHHKNRVKKEPNV